MGLLANIYHALDISLVFHVYLLVLVYVILQQLTGFSADQCKPVFV